MRQIKTEASTQAPPIILSQTDVSRETLKEWLGLFIWMAHRTIPCICCIQAAVSEAANPTALYTSAVQASGTRKYRYQTIGQFRCERRYLVWLACQENFGSPNGLPGSCLPQVSGFVFHVKPPVRVSRLSHLPAAKANLDIGKDGDIDSNPGPNTERDHDFDGLVDPVGSAPGSKTGEGAYIRDEPAPAATANSRVHGTSISVGRRCNEDNVGADVDVASVWVHTHLRCRRLRLGATTERDAHCLTNAVIYWFLFPSTASSPSPPQDQSTQAQSSAGLSAALPS